ncbi:HEAT repeat domain-containing protein [Streptomyces sp. NPDC091292]|uniref:HEAT repeat domain-containing protein n=1 Tax=Streptomyces sp. NPDC091292 TaxID=3365991 RepID=UPI0037FE48AD
MIDKYDGLLAGLDEVDWANLEAGAEVPDRLRALCGEDDKVRQKALGGLFNGIFHQGSRYQASPFVVPFLARLAVAGPRPLREELMWMLTRLAVDWHDEYDVATGINIVAWRAVAAQFTPDAILPWYDEQLAVEKDEQRREQLLQARAAVAAGMPVDARDAALRSYDAVLAELPLLLALLDDDEPRIRIRTAYLLAWFPEASAGTLPRLFDLAERDHDSVVTATALVAAGLVGTLPRAGDLAPYLEDGDGLVRWAAATALIRIASSCDGTLDAGLLDRATAELAVAAVNPAPTPATDYNEGDFHGHIETTLRTLATGVPQAALAACLPRIERDRNGRRTRAALDRLFPAPLQSPLPCYADLPAAQAQLVHALANLEHPWVGRAVAGQLHDRGLPDSQNALRAYAGLPPVTEGWQRT